MFIPRAVRLREFMLKVLVFAVAAAGVAFVAQAAAYSEAQCYVDGFETRVRCVSISAGDYVAAEPLETIKITAAIVPATTARPEPDPLFVFAGGPGQAATGMAPWLDSAFKPARRERDIVLFDIRGTGMSGAIDCPFPLSGNGDPVLALKRDAAGCAAKFGAKGTFYSSREIVEDIERFGRARLHEDQSLGRVVRNPRRAALYAPLPRACARRRARWGDAGGQLDLR